jgi:hypothetical protein
MPSHKMRQAERSWHPSQLHENTDATTMTPNQTPEQIARDKIDAMLLQAGWAIQTIGFGSFNLNKANLKGTYFDY